MLIYQRGSCEYGTEVEILYKNKVALMLSFLSPNANIVYDTKRDLNPEPLVRVKLRGHFLVV